MLLRIGISPCPNDTFIFDAMLNQRIDTQGYTYEFVFADIEQLNQMAFNGELDIIKVSYHAFLYLTEKYVLMDSGSALGYGCGPLLVSNKKYNKEEISNLHIGIPGKYTTANLLFSLAFPQASKKTEILFSDIEEAILQHKCEAGLVIHENRFTYEQKGLIKLLDLGEYWEQTTGLPIPLGGIIANRKLASETILTQQQNIRKSIEFAFKNPENSLSFVLDHAQSMDPKVVQKHIELYVNQNSLSLGEKGRNAIDKLFALAIEKHLITSYRLDYIL